MRDRTVSISTLALALAITFHADVVRGQSGGQAACRELADLRIEDTNLLAAAVVPASGDLPEYCRVFGYVLPAINFEVRLPTDGWNGKFYMAGCWGFCGTLVAAPDFIHGINRGLQRGYAASTMDTGHWGEDIFDATWAYHDRRAEIDFAYRAVHETARVTKTLIEAFYGRRPEHSYFGGCSGGGRQAVTEALRYPEDFDGIISGCPWLDTDGNAMLSVSVAEANTGPDGRNLITPSKVPLVREAVYSACDALDGLEDGLISDPRACRFDPATLACESGETEGCLSEDQVEALTKIYGGPNDSAGRQLYPGVPPGSTPDWIPWVTGETDYASDDLHRRVATQYMRYMAFREDPGEAYLIEEFDFNRDPPRLELMAEIFSVDDTNLDAFRESGGKLLMWHGWADAAIPPVRSIAYYEAVEERLGSREATQDFLRLFVVPGMIHCGFPNGPGITDTGFDPLTALETWVEHGKAPPSLLTTKTDSTGQVLWTRPVCPYPQRAVYDGQGSTTDASNFVCADPESH